MSNSNSSNSGNKYTRRQFLADVGMAGGAGVMYGAMGVLGLVPTAADAKTRGSGPMPPVAQRLRQRNEVLVLGAGIAGLTAAYELNKLGIPCQVIEARGRPGGRNWTARGGTVSTDIDGVTQECKFDKGEYMNCGPARLPQHHITIDYCRELGVQLEVFTNQNADAYYYREGAGNLASQKVRHRTAKADYYGYVSELLAKATDRGALDVELTSTDKEALIQFLRNFGSLSSSNLYTGSSRRGYKEPSGVRSREFHPGAGTQSGTVDLPPFGLSDILQSRLGLNFSFEFGWDQAMLMFQPVGGMDRIAYALEREVKKRSSVTYNAEVISIRNEADSVTVIYRDPQTGRPTAVSGGYCICTVPPNIVAKIENNFDTPVVDALKFAVPVSTGKIGLQYRRRFWEEDEWILGGITNTAMTDPVPDANPATIWYPSYGYLGKKGVVVGYYNFGSAANYYANLSPQEREYWAVYQGQKIHGPAYADELENSFSVSWIKERFSEGGWMGWPNRGSNYQLLLEPAGRVHFAGDHLSYYIAWQAGAFESARKAVKDVYAKVTV